MENFLIKYQIPIISFALIFSLYHILRIIIYFSKRYYHLRVIPKKLQPVFENNVIELKIDERLENFFKDIFKDYIILKNDDVITLMYSLKEDKEHHIIIIDKDKSDIVSLNVEETIKYALSIYECEVTTIYKVANQYDFYQEVLFYQNSIVKK